MKNIKHKSTNKNAVIEKMNTMKWYHKIDLGNGIITPGRAYEKMWESTSCVMNKINYEEKAVLDLGSLDGYWAFEAEKRGASKIVSTDAALKGQTVSSSYKPAKLINGLNIQVPPFIESGDEVIIDTRNLEYIKKI